METELIKDRSLSSCIKTANNLLGINFAKTIKGTWHCLAFLHCKKYLPLR